MDTKGWAEQTAKWAAHCCWITTSVCVHERTTRRGSFMFPEYFSCHFQMKSTSREQATNGHKCTICCCWLVSLLCVTVSFPSMSTHQSPSPALGSESSSCSIDLIQCFFLQAFCQEPGLSNHTAHLSHGFPLQTVINKRTNYWSKINPGVH